MRIGKTRPKALREQLLAALLVVGVGWLGMPAQAREHHRSHTAPADSEAKKPDQKAPADAGSAPAAGASGEISPAAVKQLEESYRQAPNSELLYQLGVQANGQGKTVEAQDFMRRYLADPLIDANAPGRAEAERILAQTRPPSGEVQILSDQYGPVSVDGRLVGTLPLPLPLLLPVGQHTVVLELRDRTMQGKPKVINGRGMELRFSRATGAVVVTLPPAVIVLPQYVGGQVAPDVARRLQQAVEQAIGKARLAVFSSEVALARSPKLSSCLDTVACQAQLAAENEVDYTLVVRVQSKGGQGSAAGASDALSAQLSLVDADVADVASTAEPGCKTCSGEDLVTAAPDAVRKLIRDGQGRPRGTLTVSSEPPGADVKLGARVLGQTPYTHATFSGSYEVVVAKPEFEPARLQAEVKEGKPEKLAVTLVPTEPVPAALVAPKKVVKPGPRRPLWRLVLGGATLGAGVLVMGFGLSALGTAGNCVEDPTPPAIECRRRYDTGAIGGGIFGAGLAVSAAGALLIAIPNRVPREVASLWGSPPDFGLTLHY